MRKYMPLLLAFILIAASPRQSNISSGPYNPTLAKTDLATQAADVGNTTIYAVTNAGSYGVTCYVVVTQAATTSSNLPPCRVTWTDSDSNVSNTFSMTIANAGNTVGATGLTGTAESLAVIQAKAGTNIQMSTSGYASTGATPMQFALHAKVWFIGQ